MPSPRPWDPPFQDDREEILMIDVGQVPETTRKALENAITTVRSQILRIATGNPELVRTLERANLAPLEALMKQIDAPKPRKPTVSYRNSYDDPLRSKYGY